MDLKAVEGSEEQRPSRILETVRHINEQGLTRKQIRDISIKESGYGRVTKLNIKGF